MAMQANLGTIKNIHFIGIGGAGMSGIAEVLITQGYHVSGSDVSENAVTRYLATLGAKILHGHQFENINGADVVVYSSAIPKDNPELIAAREKNIPILVRAQMLAELMRSRNGIAIAGTHGKTTTTGLVTALLAEGGLDPTFVIGGTLMSQGTHARLGAGEYFIAEADESDASFLFLEPKVAVVTNIDADHLNNYGDFATLRKAFVEFLHRLPEDGLAILCSDDPIICELLPQIKRPYITYGFNQNDTIYAVKYSQEGVRCSMQVKRKGHSDLEVTVNLPGRHNVLNALAAIAIATQCGVSDVAIAAGLAKFQGTGRRFQIYGELALAQGHVLMVDDYGHHPREIAATLEAVRHAWPERRVVHVFQPHRYSRTQTVFSDFAEVLTLADQLLLLDVYSAGETPIPGINSASLCAAIISHSKQTPIHITDVKQLPLQLNTILRDGDVLLLQGAGDIGKMAPWLAQHGFESAQD